MIGVFEIGALIANIMYRLKLSVIILVLSNSLFTVWALEQLVSYFH